MTAEVLEARGSGVFKRVAKVRYRYQYQGSEFEGSRIAYAFDPVASGPVVDSFLDRVQRGAVVDVSVRPDRPRESVLQPGNRPLNWVHLAVAVVFAAYVLYTILTLPNR